MFCVFCLAYFYREVGVVKVIIGFYIVLIAIVALTIINEINDDLQKRKVGKHQTFFLMIKERFVFPLFICFFFMGFVILIFVVSKQEIRTNWARLCEKEFVRTIARIDSHRASYDDPRIKVEYIFRVDGKEYKGNGFVEEIKRKKKPKGIREALENFATYIAPTSLPVHYHPADPTLNYSEYRPWTNRLSFPFLVFVITICFIPLIGCLWWMIFYPQGCKPKF